MREAVYLDLLPSEQVRLHGTYARLLAAELEGVAAELAHHCLASNDLPGALAASVAAAREAVAVFAPGEALRHLSSALKLWERVPDPAAIIGTDRMELTLRAAVAASAAGDRHRAVRLAQDAAEAAITDASADPARVAAAHERLGLYLFETGHLEQALGAYAQAVELVPVHPPTPLRARVVAAMADAVVRAGQRSQARRWCDEALAVARAVDSSSSEAMALLALGFDRA